MRPFVLETIELNTIPDLVITDQKAVNDCLRNKVMSMIEKAKKQWAETHADTPNWKEVHPFPRPLIRLKVLQVLMVFERTTHSYTRHVGGIHWRFLNIQSSSVWSTVFGAGR